MQSLGISTRKLFIAILFIGLFVMATREVADADFWWHLRTGQYIIENRIIPHTDPFSFTGNNREWVTHEWLSEIILYSLYRIGGLGLLALVFAGIITSAFGLAYIRSNSKPYIAGFVMLLGAIASAPIWGVRPQMFSLLLFSIYLVLLEKYFQTKHTKYLIALPFLMLLWVNLHAGYALGLVLIAVFIAGNAIKIFLPDNWITTEEVRPHPNILLPAIGSLIACILADSINPNGVWMFIYPFQTLTSGAMQAFIQEWASPDFHQYFWLPLAGFFLALIASGLFSRQRSSITEIALVICFGFAALRSMRNVPLFSIIAIPVLTRHVAGLLPIKMDEIETKISMRKINLILMIFVLFAGGIKILATLSNQNETEKLYFPTAAVEWIEQNQPEGNIYNTYGWGGYLIWHLYPGYKVYIDGRADVYGDQFMNDYVNIYNAKPGWEQKLKQNNVNILVIENKSPIDDYLTTSSQWQKVLSDDLSVLYVRRKD
jgi:hypothetical protein